MKMHSLAGAALILVALTKIASCEPTEIIAADDPRIDYDGYVNKTMITVPEGGTDKFVQFDRQIDMPGKGYRWDNPGATIRFRTDATEMVGVFNYSDKHVSTSARNGMGIYSVDGVFKRQWCFQPKQREVVRKPELLLAPIQNGGVAGFHDYEMFMPYGDSVDFGGLKVNPGAVFEPIKTKPKVRYVAYGDSITHGFSSSEVSKSYPFLLAKAKGWQAINLGLGGRASTPSDAQVIIGLKPDVVTVLMGANDWQVGVQPEKYRANMQAFISSLRAGLPETPIYFLTSLWVNSSWNPAGKVADLEAYRQVLREVVAAQKDPNMYVIEGPALIDQVPALYDQVPVHPNDRGFAMMAERLGQQVKDVAPKAAN